MNSIVKISLAISPHDDHIVLGSTARVLYIPFINSPGPILGVAPASATYINLLEPTGHVMHHQFNIQQLYVLPTLYLCVLHLPENKQRLVPLTA
jgi:hypothetical protein